MECRTCSLVAQGLLAWSTGLARSSAGLARLECRACSLRAQGLLVSSAGLARLECRACSLVAQGLLAWSTGLARSSAGLARLERRACSLRAQGLLVSSAGLARLERRACSLVAQDLLAWSTGFCSLGAQGFLTGKFGRVCFTRNLHLYWSASFCYYKLIRVTPAHLNGPISSQPTPRGHVPSNHTHGFKAP